MDGEQVFVFDACAIVALLDEEPGAEVVEGLLRQASARCVIHMLNVCEVYYHVHRTAGQNQADRLTDALTSFGFVLDATLTPELWRAAARLKAEWRRVSLADCFAVALTRQEQATLLTSDHHELARLSQAQVCSIRFIR